MAIKLHSKGNGRKQGQRWRGNKLNVSRNYLAKDLFPADGEIHWTWIRMVSCCFCLLLLCFLCKFVPVLCYLFMMPWPLLAVMSIICFWIDALLKGAEPHRRGCLDQVSCHWKTEQSKNWQERKMSLMQHEKECFFLSFLSCVSRFPVCPALCCPLGLSVFSPWCQSGTSLALTGEHRTCCWSWLPVTLLWFSFAKPGRCSLSGRAGQSDALATLSDCKLGLFKH